MYLLSSVSGTKELDSTAFLSKSTKNSSSSPSSRIFWIIFCILVYRIFKNKNLFAFFQRLPLRNIWLWPQAFFSKNIFPTKITNIQIKLPFYKVYLDFSNILSSDSSWSWFLSSWALASCWDFGSGFFLPHVDCVYKFLNILNIVHRREFIVTITTLLVLYSPDWVPPNLNNFLSRNSSCFLTNSALRLMI